MANQNKPFGLAPLRVLGGVEQGQTTRYYIYSDDASAYYLGDAVISAAQGDLNGVPGVAKATAGTETLRGVIVGVEPANQLQASISGMSELELSRTSIPATKTHAYYVYVDDNPATVFSIQGDATATNQIATNTNKNFSLTVAAGATTVSSSGTVVNSASIATGNTLNMKLMGLVQGRGVEYGAYAIWQAKINLHELCAAGTTAI